MKTITLLLLSLLCCTSVSAQECDTPIAIVMTKQMKGLNDTQKEYLSSKMEQLVAAQGVTASFSYTPFFLTASVNGIQKETLSTMPVSMTCQCDIVFKLMDRAGMKTIATQLVNVRGAGNTETKAMQNALKLINPQNKLLTDFIKSAKSKVLAYYNQHTTQIIAQANRLAKLEKYEEAFNLLTSVPECCDQYKEVTRDIVEIYPKARNKVGENYLKQARMIWTANQTSEAAEEACYWLSMIDPKSSAYAAGEKLYAEIKGRVKEEVRHEMKVYNDNVDLIKEQIRAAMEIGKAYGRGQQTEINVIK